MTDTAILQAVGAVALLLVGAAITFVVQLVLEKRKEGVRSLEAIAAERARALDAAAAEMDRMRARLGALETDNALLKKEVQPISIAMQTWLVDKLTHFHTPVMDELLRKLGPPNILTDVEEKELEAALIERTVTLDGRIDDMEKDAARMLPMVIRMVKAEVKAPDTLQIVSTPAKAKDAAEAVDGKEEKEGEPSLP